MRLPSVTTLAAVTNSPKALRYALEQYRDDKETLRATMERADELVGGYGCEYIRHRLDGMRVVYGLEYVNLGDTYAVTLIYNHRNNRFIVGSWGDMVEKSAQYV